MAESSNAESFSEFKDSFAYGSRTDLSFKFLQLLTETEGANFFQDLLRKVSETIDDGNLDRLVDHVVDGQIHAYREPANWRYDNAPFAALPKAVSELQVGLLTSTGHFVEGEDPEPLGVKEMSQEEATERIQDFIKAAPELSEIPLGTPKDQLRARHGGYDIRGVLADPNVALPLDRMVELEKERVVGTAVSPAYSFVGAAAQRRLLSQCCPVWLNQFQQKKIEGMILVPV